MTRLITLAGLAMLGLTILLGTAPTPAHAAGCGRAGDAIAAALCTHPELRGRAERWNQLVTDARVRRGQPENRIIGRLAATWEADRAALCPKADLVCLRLIYNDQIAFWSRIDGMPGHSDRLRFVSFRHERKAGQPGQGSFKAEFDGFIFADPTTGAQRHFNHDVEAVFTDLRKAIADDANPADRSDVGAYVQVSVHAPTWTGRLLSVRLINDTFTGGAHGLQTTWNLNLDVDADRKFRLTDRLSPRTVDTVARLCADRIAADAKQSGFDSRAEIYAPGGRSLTKAFNDLTHRTNRWSLSSHRIVLTIPQYTLGGMALGEPTCEIGAGELASLGGCIALSDD